MQLEEALEKKLGLIAQFRSVTVDELLSDFVEGINFDRELKKYLKGESGKTHKKVDLKVVKTKAKEVKSTEEVEPEKTEPEEEATGKPEKMVSVHKVAKDMGVTWQTAKKFITDKTAFDIQKDGRNTAITNKQSKEVVRMYKAS